MPCTIVAPPAGGEEGGPLPHPAATTAAAAMAARRIQRCAAVRLDTPLLPRPREAKRILLIDIMMKRQMPIIGHTLVGIVVAQQVEPRGSTRAHPPGQWTHVLWLPTIVALSYLPDVLTHLGVWLGVPSAQAAGHSMIVACVLGVAIGASWSRLAASSPLRTIALATGVLLLHDALDLLQDVERMPLWPLSMRQVGTDWLMFTDRLSGEAVAFGLPFAAYQLWRIATRRPLLGATTTTAAVRWTAGLFACGVLVTTVGVSYLRDIRGAQLRAAEAHWRSGELHEALAFIDAAERWPSSAGRGDLLRGQVYAVMGQDEQAEQAMLRAYRRNPDAFWPNAVLAEFHASRGSVSTRLERSAPYVEVLRTRFATHEALPSVMARIQQHIDAARQGR